MTNTPTSYLIQTAVVQLDNSGNGTASIKPEVGQYWYPTQIRVSCAGGAASVCYCVINHGDVGSPLLPVNFVDDTFAGNFDSTGMLNGVCVQYGEVITATWSNGMPGDIAVIKLYGVSSSVPPSIDPTPLLGRGSGPRFRGVTGLTTWDYRVVKQGDPELPNPSAGNDFTLTIPTNSLWELLFLSFQNVASGAVANRLSVIQVLSGTIGDVRWQIFPGTGATQTASTTTTTRYSVGVTPTTFNSPPSDIQAELPPKVVVSDGYRIKSAIINLQGGDQISGVRATFRKYDTTRKVTLT